MTDLAADLPTFATLAFLGLVPEQFAPITEADVFDAQKQDDLACEDEWDSQDEDESFDPDLGRYDEIDERLAWGGMDVPS